MAKEVKSKFDTEEPWKSLIVLGSSNQQEVQAEIAARGEGTTSSGNGFIANSLNATPPRRLGPPR